MRATVWSGREAPAGPERPGSADPQPARCDREDHLDRDLRLGPASLRRLRPDDGERATSSATSSWAKSSKWAAREQPEGRRPRRRAVPDRLRQLLRSASRGLSRSARTRTRTRAMAEKMLGPLARRASSATRTCSAASPAARPSTRACRSPTSARSRSRTDLTDEQVLFLSDIFPTGYMGAEMCDIQPGDTIAVWGCGPGRAVRDQERLSARRRARHRDRPFRRTGSRWRRAGGRRRRVNYEEVEACSRR